MALVMAYEFKLIISETSVDNQGIMVYIYFGDKYYNYMFIFLTHIHRLDLWTSGLFHNFSISISITLLLFWKCSFLFFSFLHYYFYEFLIFGLCSIWSILLKIRYHEVIISAVLGCSIYEVLFSFFLNSYVLQVIDVYN